MKQPDSDRSGTPKFYQTTTSKTGVAENNKWTVAEKEQPPNSDRGGTTNKQWQRRNNNQTVAEVEHQ